jgi:hypothetical protein
MSGDVADRNTAKALQDMYGVGLPEAEAVPSRKVPRAESASAADPAPPSADWLIHQSLRDMIDRQLGSVTEVQDSAAVHNGHRQKITTWVHKGQPWHVLMTDATDDGDEVPVLLQENLTISGRGHILAAIRAGLPLPPTETAAPPPAPAPDLAALHDLAARVEQIAGDTARAVLAMQGKVSMLEQTMKQLLQQRNMADQQLELQTRASALQMGLTALGAPNQPIAEAGPVQVMFEAMLTMLRS